jgi:hypothetical protein
MFLEDVAGKAFSLVHLKKLAAAGVNDLGAIASKTSPLPQAAASNQRQRLQTRALQKAAPPPVASSKPSTMAPKPLDISMPKLAALNKLQLLLTKAGFAQPVANSGLLPAAPNVTTTTPIQRAQNLHANKLTGASEVESTIQDNGPISTVGNVNGNAGQGVRNAGTKLAMVKIRKLLNSRV